MFNRSMKYPHSQTQYLYLLQQGKLHYNRDSVLPTTSKEILKLTLAAVKFKILTTPLTAYKVRITHTDSMQRETQTLLRISIANSPPQW